MVGEPLSDSDLIDFPGRQRNNDCYDFYLWRFELEPVVLKKCMGCDITYPLVAIYERMVTNNAYTICSSKIEHCRVIAIGKEVPGAIQCALKQPGIANTHGTARSSYRFRMQCLYNFER